MKKAKKSPVKKTKTKSTITSEMFAFDLQEPSQMEYPKSEMEYPKLEMEDEIFDERCDMFFN